jgi:glutamyl-tRNA synthetase
MVNFLALLGWSPGTDQELFTKDELVAAFDLTGISGGNAVFNPEKLDWMNAQHVARIPPADIAARIRPDLEAAGLWSADLAGQRAAWLQRAIALVLPRVKRLDDLGALLEPFLRGRVEYDPAAVEKHLGAAGIADLVGELAAAYEALDVFDEATTEAALRATAQALGVKAGPLIHAVRVGVTGKAVSPGLFDVLALVGQPTVVTRLHDLERFLRGRP